MVGVDYSYFRRETYLPENVGSQAYDIFISSYNESERVVELMAAVSAAQKYWLIHDEYGLKDDPSTAACISPGPVGEIEYWAVVFRSVLPTREARTSLKIGIDITGMMRPVIAALMHGMRLAGLQSVDVFYSDPVAYVRGAETKFSQGGVERVSQIPGFEGSHWSDASVPEVLVLGAGYDSSLHSQVLESRRSASHYVMFGLPGLQAHMYQDAVFRFQEVVESWNERGGPSTLHAPANDPFATASELQRVISELESESPDIDLYLCAVGSKSQVLGFALYHYFERRSTSTSLIFPYSVSYSAETSVGWSRTHVFETVSVIGGSAGS